MSQAVPLSLTIPSSGEVSNAIDNATSSSSSVGGNITEAQTKVGPTPFAGSIKQDASSSYLHTC
jgi:hypothetical protein